MSNPRVSFMLQPHVHFYKKRAYARIVEHFRAVESYAQTSLGALQALAHGPPQNVILPPEPPARIVEHFCAVESYAQTSLGALQALAHEPQQNVILPPETPEPPARLNLGGDSCPTYGYIGKRVPPSQPPPPLPRLNLSNCAAPSYGLERDPATEPPLPPQPPPPLDLSRCGYPTYGCDTPTTPRLSIGIPFSNLDTHHHDEPTPDYANSPLSAGALEEIRNARTHEAATRAEAIAQAYSGFVREDTPLHHLTPHSQRTPASYLSHMSSPPNMSPLALSPKADATPKAEPTPKATFPLLPTIMSDSALSTLADTSDMK